MAIKYLEIPLRAEQQRLGVSLDQTDYFMVLTWCAPMSYWVLELQDSGGNRLLAGVPLIIGADLLAQYKHIGLKGALVVQSDTNPQHNPTYTDLGGTSHLYYITDDGNG